MPNWCINRLIVKGDAKAVQQFIRRASGKPAVYAEDRSAPNEAEGDTPPLIFHALVPVPQEVLEQGYSDVGYDWQIEHWGTKWDLDEKATVKRSGNQAIYYFETAWTPPLAWLRSVAKQFSTLRFELTYSEPGWDLHGTLMMACGSEIAHLVHETDDLFDQYLKEAG